MALPHLLLASASVHWGGFKWWGNFTTVDLIAASTNALNGALLARRPDHYKQFTIVGIILTALLGGLGGGITRDVLVAQVLAALTNPAYITLCLIFGFVGYHLAFAELTGGSSVGYHVVGIGYALLGIAFLACGFHRQRQQEAGLLEGRFVPFAPSAALAFAVAGIVLGTATAVVVIT
jgi:hypothetical protein